MAERLDRILEAAQRAVRQIPCEHLGFKWPGRNRTIRQLGYHIFRVALSYRDTREQGMLQEYWFGENPLDDIQDGEAVARYGDTVRQRVTEWLQRDDAYDGMCETYYGPQAAPELFERTVWHAAQHLRQVYVMLETLGVTPDRPLTEVDYTGLPLPDSIW
ncbi:MAG: DinB family protein [Candidatus Tectomicrobia bacterium]|nr:DinB family protein [Candidatus Tectomicrobia bacterium]